MSATQSPETHLATPSNEAVSVATMRPGDLVDTVLACVRKERQITRAGTPYLTIELRDRTGSIVGRAFRDADLLAASFERGELVRVGGRVARYRDELQLEVQRIVRAEDAKVDLERFLPVCKRDLDELEGFFEHLVREIYDPALRGLLESMLADRVLRAELRKAPCSIPSSGSSSGSARGTHHHAYLGGLLEHTVAVATMAFELCALHPRLDRDLLLTAALVHDIGKTREFVYGAEILRSDEGRLLGHVELGLRLIDRHIPASLDRARRLALEHCVIVHHGTETAAQERFASPEAIALFRINALDGHLKSAFERGLGTT
jgi:3'-5' exoribonuclease